MYLVKADLGLLPPTRRPLSQGAIIIATDGDIDTDNGDVLGDSGHLGRGSGLDSLGHDTEGDNDTDGGCDLGDSKSLGMRRGLHGFEYSGSLRQGCLIDDIDTEGDVDDIDTDGGDVLGVKLGMDGGLHGFEYSGSH